MKLREKPRSREQHLYKDNGSVVSHTSSSDGDDANLRTVSPEYRPTAFNRNNGSYVRLLRNERYAFAGYHDLRSAGIESRFTCTSGNVDQVCQLLQERSNEIAKANPFVFGRLVRKKRQPGVKLWIPKETSEGFTETFLRTVWVDGEDFESGLPYCCLGNGKTMINEDVPVVKLCVVRSRNPAIRDILITCCVSHVIGEPHTFYSIMHMLNKESEIRSLIVNRVHNFRGNPITSMKGPALWKFLRWVLRGTTSPLHYHKRQSYEESDEKVHMRCCRVNMAWVNEQKMKHSSSTPGAPYLSTQDIVSSWFFSQLEPDFVVVAFDLRTRCKELTMRHQGNYQDALVLYPKEYKDPVHIRRAIASQGAWTPAGNSFKHTSQTGIIGGITGWQAHFSDLCLPNTAAKYHGMPLRDPDGQLPSLKDPPKLILFKISSSDFAMWYMTEKELTDRRAIGPAQKYE